MLKMHIKHLQQPLRSVAPYAVRGIKIKLHRSAHKRRVSLGRRSEDLQDLLRSPGEGKEKKEEEEGEERPQARVGGVQEEQDIECVGDKETNT